MSIDPATFRRLGALFQELCDAPPEVQQDRLATLEDGELAAQLARMLQVDRRTTRALQTDGGAGARRVLALDLARETPPERIGPFEIVGVLGAGAMGMVYEAQQAHPRRRLALKVMHTTLVSDEARALFRFEAQSLANLRHPNVPQVYDAGEDGERPWMAMELVRGQPLDQFVAATRLGARERVALAIEVALAVHHAHSAGILHRDLKPSNVLVTAEGVPKVLDFGIATSLLESRAEGRFLGTPGWASPEQLRGEQVDVTTDVYALATLVHQLLAGRLPYAVDDLAPSAAARVKEATAPPLVGRDIPADVAWWVARALSADPADRPSTAEAFADGLRRALADQPLPGRGGAGYRLRCFGRRHRRGLLAGGFAAVVALAGVGARAGWERAVAHERESAAERHRVALDQTLDGLAAEGRWSEVETLFAAFALLPEHEGTVALARAYTSHGLRRARGDQPRDLHALAEGWLGAPAARQAAGEVLVAALLERARYDEAGDVARQLELTPPVRDAIARSEVAAGDLRQATLGAAPRGILERLSRATRIPRTGERARLVDVDGDGAPELVSLTPEGDVEVSAPGDPAPRRLHLPTGTEASPRFLAREGRLYAVVRCCDSFHGTPRILVAGAGDFTELAALPPARPSSAAFLGDRLYVGTTYPTRGLWSVDLASGAVARPDEELNARGEDVTALLAADLTGDGVQELVVGTNQELRLSTRDGDALVLQAKVAVAGVSALAPGPPRTVWVQGGELAPATLGNDGLALGLPRPLRHETAASRCSPTIEVDLDGDGTRELVVSCQDDNNVRTHLLGADPSDDLVVLGWWVLDADDVDGDGLPELLVASDGALWLLGMGPQTKVRQAPVRLHLDLLPGLDATARGVWSRAGQLLEVGLAEQAADLLASVAPLLDDPEHRAGTHVAAARISEQLGDRPAATREWVAAAEGPLPPEALREARRSARDALAHALRLQEARGLDDDGTLAWLDEVATVPVLDKTILDTGWTVHRPESLSRRDGTWGLDTYNDDGLLLSLPVDLTGDAVGLELELWVRSAELASGVAVQLVDDAGRVLLGAGVDAWGFGRTVRLRTRGLLDGDMTLGDYAEDERLHTVRTFWLPERGRAVVDEGGRPFWHAAGPVPPRGRYQLRILAHGDLEYAPALGIGVDVRALRLYGLEPVAVPGRVVPPAAVAQALGTGDPAALAQALADLVRAEDWGALRRWLRRSPTWVAPALLEVMGRDAGTLFAEAWAQPFAAYPDRPEVRAAALSPALDAVAVTDETTGFFALARGRLLLRAGHPDHAARVLRGALQLPVVAPRAHAALALALEASDPVAAEQHRAEARRLGVEVKAP